MQGVGTERGRLERGSSGFTLVEVMVIVIVIGVLIAIGLPTFLGARNKASDTAAKARATAILKTQKVAASDADQRFRTAAELAAEDSSVEALPLVSGVEPTVLGVVYVKDPSGGLVTLVARSSTGKCFWTRASSEGGSQYAVNDCQSEPADAPVSEWKASW